MQRLLIISKGADFKFVDRIIPYLAKRYEVSKIRDVSQKDLDDCKIAWFEWCDEALVKATQNLRKTCRIIARAHRYEIFRPKLFGGIDWSKVDDLIFEAAHILRYAKQKYPRIKKTNIHLVRDAIEIDKFTFKQRVRTKKIAAVAYIKFVKNFPLLMQCFKKLYDIDKDYELHIAGEVVKDLELPRYLSYLVKKWNMENSVIFHGYVKHLNSWLEDKEFIVSSSISEGCQNAILEGMCKGIKPIIHCWPGADEIFDKELIFTTIDEFVEIVKGPYEPKRYRKFVEENFNVKDRVKEILEVLNKASSGGV